MLYLILGWDPRIIIIGTGSTLPEMSSSGDSDGDGSDKDVPKISPEERAVLLQCRRQSMMRGLVAGSGLCLAIYWFKAQGRVPSFITQFPRLTYTMGFFAAFSSGAGSYQKTCLQKLMALEHSVIADTYRKAIENNGKGTCVNTTSKPDRPPPPSFMPKPQVRAQTSPQAPNVQLNEGPAINMSTYARDKAVLETRTDEEEQPSAFSDTGGEDRQSPRTLSVPPPQEDSGKRRRRTFNEIREENRRRHSQPPNHSPSQSGSKPGEERKKFNKYGDVIE